MLSLRTKVALTAIIDLDLYNKSSMLSLSIVHLVCAILAEFLTDLG